MRTIRASLMAGAAIAALAGYSGWAEAQSPQIHVMTVQLPGGGIEQIRYTGDTPPQVTVDSGPSIIAFGPTFAAFAPTFAAFDRVSAAMDRQAAALLQQTAALAAQPAASPGYGFCEQSIQITSTGNGPPKVVRHTSGNCAPSGGATGSVSLPAAQPLQHRGNVIMTKAAPRYQQHRPDVVMAKAEAAAPYLRMASEVGTSGR